MGIANKCLIVLLAAFLCISVVDLLSFAVRPDAYPWASEAAGRRYTTVARFVLVSAAEVVMAAAGVFAHLFIAQPTRLVSFRVLVAVVLIAIAVMTRPPG